MGPGNRTTSLSRALPCVTTIEETSGRDAAHTFEVSNHLIVTKKLAPRSRHHSYFGEKVRIQATSLILSYELRRITTGLQPARSRYAYSVIYDPINWGLIFQEVLEAAGCAP